MRNETLTDALKQEIMLRIRDFSEEQLRQILDYITMLNYHSQSSEQQNSKKFLDEYIGGVSHGMLAEDIDRSVYG